MTIVHGADWTFGAPVRGYHWACGAPIGRVLLQHGYGEHAERFVTRYSELIPRLLERGLDVYALDMPGHGQSPGRRGSVDVREAARYHLAATRALNADGPVVLFGHSLGALVTAHTVVTDAAGVNGVVLTSAALPAPPGPALRGIAATLTTVAPHGPAPVRAASPSTLARPAENAALIASDPLMYTGRLTNLTAHTALLTAKEVWRRTTAWTVPTMILHGDADRSTDPRGSRRLLDAIASTDKTLDIIEGGRHELLNDDERKTTLAQILEWVTDHASLAASS